MTLRLRAFGVHICVKNSLHDCQRRQSLHQAAVGDRFKVLPSGHSKWHTSRRGLHQFSRGRFVCNEEHEMMQRAVSYDINELGKVAATALGSNSCTRVEQYPDGMYNKAMLFTMNDGKQAVAKISNPNSGQPHFTTASEVATMEFARNTLGIPAPQVYAWCSRTSETSVGAEYIIMEKVPGVPLEKVFGKMSIEDRFTVTKSIINYQRVWGSTGFNMYGSLYYAQDLLGGSRPLQFRDQAGFLKTDDEFSIGPTTGRDWNDDGRISIDFDRGPWSSSEQYMKAIGERELASVQQISQLPKSLVTLCGPGTFQPTREKKTRAIRRYLDLVETLSPSDTALRKACLWHGDLHSENIFVNPSNPTEITAIIDWQSTEIAPLFVQARQPHFLDYDGPQLPGLERAHLPSGLDKLPATEQNRAKALYFNQSFCALYRTLIKKRCPSIWKSLEFQESTDFDLSLMARNFLVDGEATYMAHLLESAESPPSDWEDIRSSKLQVWMATLSSSEKESIVADAEGALRGMDAMRDVRDRLGALFPERGIVAPEQYAATKDALRKMKGNVIEKYAQNDVDILAWQESWPFDD